MKLKLINLLTLIALFSCQSEEKNDKVLSKKNLCEKITQKFGDSFTMYTNIPSRYIIEDNGGIYSYSSKGGMTIQNKDFVVRLIKDKHISIDSNGNLRVLSPEIEKITIQNRHDKKFNYKLPSQETGAGKQLKILDSKILKVLDFEAITHDLEDDPLISCNVICERNLSSRSFIYEYLEAEHYRKYDTVSMTFFLDTINNQIRTWMEILEEKNILSKGSPFFSLENKLIKEHLDNSLAVISIVDNYYKTEKGEYRYFAKVPDTSHTYLLEALLGDNHLKLNDKNVEIQTKQLNDLIIKKNKKHYKIYDIRDIGSGNKEILIKLASTNIISYNVTKILPYGRTANKDTVLAVGKAVFKRLDSTKTFIDQYLKTEHKKVYDTVGVGIFADTVKKQIIDKLN